MPRFRPDIEEHITPPDYRTFFPHPHPQAMKITIRQTLEAVQAPLERRFEEIKTSYRDAHQAKEVCDAFLARVAANQNSWDGLEPAEYYAASERVRYAEQECEWLSEFILFTLDSIVTALVSELTGRETCTDAGEPFCGPYTVDRILDAVGNYLRHRYEWASQRGKTLSPQQRASMFPLARLLSGAEPASDPDATAIVMSTRYPARRVLEALTAYDRDGEAARFETAHERIVNLTAQLIDRYFAEWFKRKFQRT